MKKLLAFFSAVTFLGSTTLAVSACGVPQGAKIETIIKTAPEKATEEQDPRTEYVYNNQYNYSSANVNYLLGVSANLASDKIRTEEQSGSMWEEFYQSDVWRYGSFSSIHYEVTGENAFSFRDGSNNEFIYQIKNNDASVDENRLMTYWVIVSATPGGSPSKSNISMPSASEFEKDGKVITRTGWIHLFLWIGAYQIDFNAEINFNFTRITDKNNQQVVLFDLTSFSKPFGDIDFNKPPYDKISNLDISAKPAEPDPDPEG